ncbi:MAG TPA: methionyl-tRNA formyltransferase [Gemmatimonadota bacterium]|nr:methionyl-tRNA formyltransferase [Gemmatimonadota bacterium]
MRVVFWGSPEFAVAVLESVLASGHEVAGVVTRPPRPVGRGRRVRPTPVAQLADSAGVPVLAPKRLREAAFASELAGVAADVFLVAAYGRVLPPAILSLPSHGSLNVHASLLPDYRGAAPVTRAILDGRSETGITIMRMEEGLDTGAICLQARVPILAEDTAETLTSRLAALGGRLAVESLDRLQAGTLAENPQDDTRATYAEKVSTEEARVDWSRPAAEIERAARAFDPWPGAWTTFRGERLKVFRVSPRPSGGAEPGEVTGLDPAPVVEAGGGAVRLDLVQPPGSRRMSGADWARGRAVRPGERLGR